MSKSPRRKQPCTNRAEIHSHTTASDGEMSPTALAEFCHQAGVEVWALTDHDNCLGCEEASAAARRLGIEFIPGIEISAFAGRSIHILGYGVDPASETMRAFGRRRIKMRIERMETMVATLAELDVAVSMERVRQIAGDGGVMGRPHLAQALLAEGHVETIQEAFDLYIGTGKPAHAHMTWPSVPEAIAIIHRAGGVAVSAHPGQYGLADETITEWVEAGLDGLEIIHPDHNAEHEARLNDLADKFGLLKTASSDFHGRQHKSWDYFGKVDFPEPWLQAFLDAVR